MNNHAQIDKIVNTAKLAFQNVNSTIICNIVKRINVIGIHIKRNVQNVILIFVMM